MDDWTHGDETLAPAEMFLRDGTTAFEKGKLPKPRSRLLLVFLLGFAVLLGLGVYRIATTFRAPRESGADQQTAPQPVGVATVGTGDIKIVATALGTVTPIATVTVRTQVNGQLLEVGFKEGQWVKKGDFLAQIDPRPFQLAKAQFEGQLAGRRSQWMAKRLVKTPPRIRTITAAVPASHEDA
jgi:membrane fusion protein, multidrug efflux system